jgi:hypothetical protein
VFQPDHFEVAVAGVIDALHDPGHATDVGCAVRNDQHVRARVRGQVRRLGHHRAQDRHQLRRRYVSHLKHLGHDFVRRRTDSVRRVVGRQLPGSRIRHDLDHVAGRHRDESMHLEYREKGLIEGRGTHRRIGQHRHLGADPRIDDEVLAGDLAHGLDDLAEIRILVVRRDLRVLRSCRERQRECQQQGQSDVSGHA